MPTVAILTPIPVEFQAVAEHLSDLQEVFHQDIAYYQAPFAGKKHKYNIVLRETGSNVADIALATQHLIQAYQPDILLLVGIAGGVKDVAIGDVVIGTKAYGYEFGKATDEGFVARPEVVPYSLQLLERAKAVARKDEWKKRIKDLDKDPNVIFGPIAAGNKVIASTKSEEYKMLKKHFNDTTALEMESIGTAKALLYHPHIRTLNIRGVSDLLDHKSDTDAEGSQEKAVAHAAAFAFELLYQLDASSFLKQPAMDTKQAAQNVMNLILPKLQQDAGQTASVVNSPFLNVLMEKIQEIAGEEFEDLKAAPDDDDEQVVLRKRIEKKLKKSEDLQKQLAAILEKINTAGGDTTTNISDSKNVVHDSTISAGGNVQIGDNTDNSGQVINQGVINITQVVESASKQQSKAEQSATVQDIQHLAQQHNLKPAIEKLLDVSSSMDSSTHNQAILLASRWNRLQQSKNSGVIGFQDSSIEENRIVAALLSTLQDLN